MAKYERELSGDFQTILDDLENTIIQKSFSSSKEAESNFEGIDSRCAVRVYERYSYLGGNRVSLNITLVELDKKIYITAITSGGSQAVFFKINTFGESAFLDIVVDIIDKYAI